MNYPLKNYYIMKTLLSVFISTFLSIGISAQTVSGKLIDENSQPLPYANVVLLSLPDSTFVTGTISGEDGTFSLATTAGKQLVRISSIGYNTLYRPTQPADMGVIQLTTDAQMLGEVVVKADLPKTRVKGDAMVTTVTGSVLEKQEREMTCSIRYLAYRQTMARLTYSEAERLKSISTEEK